MALTKVTGQVINTSTDVTVGVLTVTNTLAVGGTVSIGGTLTYEDVTNIDSVGLITARNGIVVGSGITLSKDGDAFFTGVTTATKFVGANAEVSGDLSGATGTFTGNVSIADKIIHTADENTAIRFPSADTFSVETSGTQRLRVEAAGNVNFANNVNVSGTSTVTGIAQFSNTINLTHASAGQNYIYFNEDLQLAKNGTGTRLKIDSNGKLLGGNYFTSKQIGAVTAPVQIQGTSADTSALSLFRYSNDTGGSTITLGKGRGTSGGATDKPQEDDTVGTIHFHVANNNDLVNGNVAAIDVQVDDAPGGGDTPGRIRFLTSPDGSSTLAERLRIDSSGRVLMGTTVLGNGNADNLTVADSGNCGITIRSGNTNTGNIFWSDATSGADQYAGALEFHHNDNSMNFNIANAVKVKIHSGGQTNFNNGIVLGNGITYAAGNTLNDYESGNWTPTSDSGGWTIHTNYYSKYTKVGTLVHAQFYIGINGTPNTDAIVFGGLPFNSESNGYSAGSVDFGKGAIKGTYSRVEGNSDQLYFFYPSENTGLSRLPLVGNQVGINYVIGTITYYTAE